MVYVDRNFPCYQPTKASHSSRSRLIFASCEDPKEIWPLVVEKAYAKLHGSYEALNGGRIVVALCALTGGNGQVLDLQSPFCRAAAVWAMLTEGHKFGAAGCGFVGAGSQQHLEDPSAKGIVPGHAYTVLGAYEADGLRLLKLRNPWNRGEWKGDWGDGSKNWRSELGQKIAKDVAYEAKEDGEFWIPL